MLATPSRASTTQLRLGQIALSAGQPATARRLGLLALHAPGGSHKDSHARAQALLVLAQADVLESRMGSTYGLSRAALHSFEAHHDLEQCAETLGVMSYSAASLGPSDVALDAARRCGDLRRPLMSTRIHALSGNYLGVASLWARDFEGSAAALDWAVTATQDSSRPHDRFQPLTNHCFSEMLAITHARLENREVDLAPFLRLLAEGRRMALGGTVSGLSLGAQSIGMTLLVFLGAQALLFCDKPEDAREYIEACRARARQLPPRSWLQALTPWLEHNEALATGDQRRAAFHAHAMRRAARLGEHLPLTELAQQLIAALVQPQTKSP
jgi:hypothetical protein